MEMNDIIMAAVCGSLFGMTILYVHTRIKLKKAQKEIQKYIDFLYELRDEFTIPKKKNIGTYGGKNNGKI